MDSEFSFKELHGELKFQKPPKSKHIADFWASQEPVQKMMWSVVQCFGEFMAV